MYTRVLPNPQAQTNLRTNDTEEKKCQQAIGAGRWIARPSKLWGIDKRFGLAGKGKPRHVWAWG